MKFSDHVRALNPGLKESELVTARVTKQARSKNRDTADDFLVLWERHAARECPNPQREYNFAKNYRFDFAWPRLLPSPDGSLPSGEGPGVGVEIDGAQHLVVYGRNGRASVGGRHNTDKDRAKLNLANELGWHVLRYTPTMLKRDPLGVIEQVQHTLINLKLWTPE